MLGNIPNYAKGFYGKETKEPRQTGSMTASLVCDVHFHEHINMQLSQVFGKSSTPYPPQLHLQKSLSLS